VVFSGRIAYPHITLTTWGRCPLAIERLSRLNVRAAGDPIIEQYAIEDLVSHDSYGLGRVVGTDAGGVTVDPRTHALRITSPST
jgi:hypothetical protein